VGLIARHAMAEQHASKVYGFPWQPARLPSLLNLRDNFDGWPLPAMSTAIFSFFKPLPRLGVFGHAARTCAAEFERDKKMPTPALLAPVQGTTLDDPSFRKRCPPPGQWPAPPGTPRGKKAEIVDHGAREISGLHDNAMLYLGPAASLTESPILPDAYLDDDYLKEIMRRERIMNPGTATPSDLGITVDKNAASPRPFFQRQ
jgi:hypothetical protein